MAFRGPEGEYFESQQPVRRLPHIEDVFYYSTINEALFNREGTQARRDAKLGGKQAEATRLALEVTNQMLADLGVPDAQQASSMQVKKDFPRVYIAQGAVEKIIPVLRTYPSPFPDEGMYMGALVGCSVLNKDGLTHSFYVYEFTDPESAQSFAPSENREMMGLVHLRNLSNQLAEIDLNYPLAVSISPAQRRAGVYEKVGGNFKSVAGKTIEVESMEFMQV